MPRAPLLTALLLVGSSCSNGWPTSADLQALMVEAAKEGRPATGHPPARCAVRDSLRNVLESEKRFVCELGKLTSRQELNFYLFRDESYIGGSFPRGVADVMRAVHEMETRYLNEMRGFRDQLASNVAKVGNSAEQRSAVVAELADAFDAKFEPIATVIAKHQDFLQVAAELYELMSAQPEAIRATRHGLEISDSALLERFNAQVDVVNGKRDEVDAALQRLDAKQRRAVHWLGLAKRIERP